MSELTDYITNGPTEVIAAQLLADPAWAGFNLLWKQPRHLLAVAMFFELATVAAAQAFAATLLDGSGWVTHRVKLTDWMCRRPGVSLAQMVPASNSVLLQVVRDKVPLSPSAKAAVDAMLPDPFVQFADGGNCLPTYAQLQAIVARCPSVYFFWHAENDCDDKVRSLRGWLSEYGIGPAAIGAGYYRAYNGTTLVGAHAVGVAICADKVPYIVEPADNRIYPITKTTLGGYPTATRIEFTQLQF